MNRRLIRFAIGFVSITAMVAGSVLVWALNEPMVPSLYRPRIQTRTDAARALEAGL